MRKNQLKIQKSRLSWQLLMRYIASLALFLVLLPLAGALLIVIVMPLWRSRVWDGTEFLWILKEWVMSYLPLFIILAVMAGWLGISWYFISKPLRYLDDLAEAARQLSHPGEEPVVLPAALAETENELNLARERAIRDAYAAKEAEQRKNDLIVYLAHDLKTPLTSVIGYLSLLRDEQGISEQLREKYTGIALDKAMRLEDLINEFFEITRFNLTHLTLEKETVNLSRMLEQITFEFTPALEEKGLFWELSIAPDVELLCDPDKLMRVFDNLLKNAVNYSYPNTAVCVSLEKEPDRACIRVGNHGKTIPEEKLERIFEQFFRLDSSRASATGGAGLGLAIAKEIAELHGGRITAESADESVTFTVRLPLNRTGAP